MDMVRIAVEATNCMGNPTGFGRYVNRLLEAFGRLAPVDWEFLLFYVGSSWRGPDFGPRFQPVSYGAGSQSRHICFSLASALARAGADMFHATCTTGAPPRSPVPVIATIHDVFPRTVRRGITFRQRIYFRLLMPFTVRTSSLLLYNSVYTEREFHRLYPAVRTAGRVIPLGCDLACEASMSQERKGPILCAGALEARKGQRFLVRAYCRAKREGVSLPPLVLVGPDRGEAKYIRDELAAAGETSVQLRGWIDDAELRSLYHTCMLQVIPSFEEGYGLPLVEGASAGIPMIASDIPVFREIAGDGVCWARPGDEDDWLMAFRAFAGGGIPPSALRRERTWDECALETLEAYRTVLKRASPDACEV